MYEYSELSNTRSIRFLLFISLFILTTQCVAVRSTQQERKHSQCSKGQIQTIYRECLTSARDPTTNNILNVSDLSAQQKKNIKTTTWKPRNESTEFFFQSLSSSKIRLKYACDARFFVNQPENGIVHTYCFTTFSTVRN